MRTPFTSGNRGVSRRIFGGVLGLSLTFSLAGCAPAAEQSGTATVALPALTTAQDIRDRIARSESAIAAATTTMASLATECEECRTALEDTSTSATQRLQTAGGLWTPWPEASADQLATLPSVAAIGEAPLTPVGLVGYMAQSSTDQLTQLAQTEDLSASELQSLAALAAGRMVAALYLASFYDISVDEAVADLPVGATATSFPVDDVASGAGNTLDSEQSLEEPQSGEPTDWENDDQATTALLAYDCVATTLGFTDLTGDDPTGEQVIYDGLQDRVTWLTSAGVPDNRTARCVLGLASADEVMGALVGADLDLLETTNPTVRMQAVQFLNQDVTWWFETGQADRVSPGLTAAAADTAQETNNDTTVRSTDDGE